MTAAIVRWRTRSGIRRTSPTDTLSVDVEAWTDLRPVGSGGEGGVAKVSFSVSENGGTATVYDVTAPSLRFPNYSDQPSPLYDDGMAPLWCHGITLDCGTLAAGTITVTAEVHSVAGTITAVPGTITIYNDSDGGDRRPCTKRIYVSPTGNDANPGTAGSPMQSIMRGVEACRANPAGSSSADFDCGGAELVLMAGVHQWARGHWGVASWHTSGDWWLTITLADGASVVRDISSGTVEPDHYVTCTGYSGGKCNVRIVGGQWQASGAVLYCSSGVSVTAWMDGATAQSQHFNETTKPYSVRFREDADQAVNLTGPGLSLGRRFMSCSTVQGVSFGPAGWSDLHDVRIRYFLGVAMQASGDETEGAANVLIEHQRYDDELAGHLSFAGGAAWTVTVPSAGQMRIDATSVQASNIATQLAEIAGTTYWGVKCSGFTSAGNNTPSGTAFAVLSTGTNGSGFPYVVLSNASAVAGSAGASARMDTARYEAGSMQTYHELIHPDLLQWNTDKTGTMHSHVAVRDVVDAQAWFSGGHTITRCALVNVSDGGGGLRWNMADSTSLVDCLFLHCSTTGPWDVNAAAGCNWINCVVSTYSGISASANYVDGCHFISGTPLGSSSSSGPWYASTTSTSPWHLTPSGGNLGSASSTLSMGTAYRFSGAADSRGVLRNVAQHDWSLSASGATMAGFAPAAWTVAAPSGSLVAGALMTGDAPAAWTVGAPTGVFVTFGGLPTDATMTGDAPDAWTIAAPTGTFAVPGLMEGNAPAAWTIAAPTGSLVAHALMAGDAPQAWVVAAPTGTFETTVLLSGPAPAAWTITAPTGSFVVQAVMSGQAPAAWVMRAPTGTLSAPDDPTPPEEVIEAKRHWQREQVPPWTKPRLPRRRWFWR